MDKIDSADVFETVGHFFTFIAGGGFWVYDQYRNSAVFVNAHIAQDLAVEILKRRA